jgi:hypothetical protein
MSLEIAPHRIPTKSATAPVLGFVLEHQSVFEAIKRALDDPSEDNIHEDVGPEGTLGCPTGAFALGS